jgi:hypothetical protein
MMFDLGTSRGRSWTLVAQLNFYACDGHPARRCDIGIPLFCGTIESGDGNACAHRWELMSAVEQKRRRAAIDATWNSSPTDGATPTPNIQMEQTKALLKAVRSGAQTRHFSSRQPEHASCR